MNSKIKIACVMAALCGTGKASGTNRPPDFDGSAQEGTEKSSAGALWFGGDGIWCEPGKPYYGGPCDDHWRGNDPGVPSFPDSHRDPRRRDPHWDPRPPRSAPIPPPDSAFPGWWDWNRPLRIASEAVDLGASAYAAASARRAPEGSDEDLAIRYLYQFERTAIWFQDEIRRKFRNDPWGTQEAYEEALTVYRNALARLEHARMPPQTRDAFVRLEGALRELQRFYDYRMP